MKESKDLDQLFEDFMQSNHVEDNGFSDAVVKKVARPRIAFLTSIYPILGGILGLIVFSFAQNQWENMDLSFFNKMLTQISHSKQSLSHLFSSYGPTAMIVIAAMVALFLMLQPEKE